MKAYYAAARYEDVVKVWDEMRHERIWKNQISQSLVLKALAALTDINREDSYSYSSNSNSKHNTNPNVAIKYAVRAHKMLQGILNRYKQHTTTTSTTATTTTTTTTTSLSTSSSSSLPSSFIPPTSNHFASVMTAWSRSRHPEAAKFCQQLFEQLQQLSSSSEATSTSTDDNVVSETTTQMTPHSAEEEEESSESLSPPSLVHYTALLTAWSYSKLPEAKDRVIEILQKIKQNQTRSGH